MDSVMHITDERTITGSVMHIFRKDIKQKGHAWEQDFNEHKTKTSRAAYYNSKALDQTANHPSTKRIWNFKIYNVNFNDDVL